MGDTVIKTTAKLHEASEPDRYKPIIRIDDKNGNTTVSHISNSNELANTIRASIDSGRDNPFRPDGEIYKMTDPIVDFYKFGPSHSRSQTPTYANLTPSKSKSSASSSSKHNKLRWRRKSPSSKINNNNSSSSGDDRNNDTDPSNVRHETESKSCWRKWFCCCCCSKCCSKKKEADKLQEAPVNGTAGPNKSQISSNIDYYNRNQAPEDLIEQSSKQRQQIGSKLIIGSPSVVIDSTDSKSQLQAPAHHLNGNNPTSKQTRVVILKDGGQQHHHHHNLELCADSGTNRSKSDGGGASGDKKDVNSVETAREVRLAKSKGKCTIS